MKCEVEKFAEVDTSLPILWYNHLGDRETRRKIYDEVVIATEASQDSKSMILMKLMVS